MKFGKDMQIPISVHPSDDRVFSNYVGYVHVSSKIDWQCWLKTV